MKKTISALALLLLLTACAGGSESEATPAPSALPSAGEFAQTLLDSGAFSETLEQVDPSVACALYGLDADTVTDCAAYLSTGATAEECTVLVLADEAAAEAAMEALKARVTDQIEALTDYQPGEISKLEHAVYTTRSDNLVCLIVPADEAKASAALGQ